MLGFGKDPATRLRILMADRDVLVNELADKSGVSPATITAIRNRRTKRPTQDTMYRIADALGVKPNNIWPWA